MGAHAATRTVEYMTGDNTSANSTGQGAAQQHTGHRQALTTLNARFETQGMDIGGSTLDAWNVTDYRDAVVFSSAAGARSNRAYLVRGDTVEAFSPSDTTIDEAYNALAVTAPTP